MNVLYSDFCPALVLVLIKKRFFYEWLIFAVIFFGASFFSVNSAPLFNVPISVLQPDSTILECFVSGDEYHRILHTAENDLIVFDGQSSYYRISETRVDKLLDFVNYQSYPEDYLSPRDFIPKHSTSYQSDIKYNNTGSVSNIVVFVRFEGDPEFTRAASYYENIFNSLSGPSLFHYYKEVSYNQLEVYSYLYPPAQNGQIVSYQDSKKSDYYRPYSVTNPIGYANSDEYHIRRRDFLDGIIKYLDKVVPEYIPLSNRGNGYVDNVTLLLRGGTDSWASGLF